MQGMRQFELLENLRSAESAQAVLLVWNGRYYARTKQVIEVFDFVGQHGCRGDRGYAFLSPESGRWEVACGLHEQILSGIGA